MRFARVRISNKRPPPGAGAHRPLERTGATRGGACQNCAYCGKVFEREPRSGRITCSEDCANRQRVKNSIKKEYWWLNSAGYMEGNVWIEGKRRRIRQHRWVMEKHLGRRLQHWEHVHHKDGNRLNNDISNLEVLDHVEHALMHNAERREANGWNPPLRDVLRVQLKAQERRARRENQ